MLRASSLLSFSAFAILCLSCAVPAGSTKPAVKSPGPETEVVRDNAMRVGDCEVTMLRAVRGKVPIKTPFGDDKSPEDAFTIYLQITNITTTKKVDYKPWSDGLISLGLMPPTLKDNFGNTYKRNYFALGTVPIGIAEGSGSIHPGKSVTDALVFEIPIPNATYLDLELPAEHYGNEGKVRFRIGVPPPPKAKSTK